MERNGYIGTCRSGPRALGEAILAWAVCSMAAMLLAFSVVPGAHAQRSATRSADELAGTLQQAVMSADAADIMRQAAETVEIDLFGERRFYSRGQATLLLNDLFKQRSPESARVVQTRRTPTAAFLEVRVVSRDGSSAEWLVRYALQRGEWRIRELTVEEADD